MSVPIPAGTNNTVIEVVPSPSHLYVSAISALIITHGDEADITATLNNSADSGEAFKGVQVKFYNGNPFLDGARVGPEFTVDLPIGGSSKRNVNLTGLGGAKEVFVFIDSNAAIGEYDETNNTASVIVSN